LRLLEKKNRTTTKVFIGGTLGITGRFSEGPFTGLLPILAFVRCLQAGVWLSSRPTPWPAWIDATMTRAARVSARL
jgi:hypothetical protein